MRRNGREEGWGSGSGESGQDQAVRSTGDAIGSRGTDDGSTKRGGNAGGNVERDQLGDSRGEILRRGTVDSVSLASVQCDDS